MTRTGRAGAVGLLAGLVALGNCASPQPVPPPSREVFVPPTSSGPFIASAAPLTSQTRPVASTSASGGACRTDADCVPAQCCHPSTCVAAAEAPVCSGMMCTRDCRGGSFECGAGACACQAGVCAVDWRTRPQP